ncbi:hypothetical protein Pcinc_009922 [Petrolisthes cinctipes]|uniref:Regulatory protein zeste n=1 Tax=Petrolisthes cinctipes TaxID=88211 RepID=A0AAE1G609_PETCI|nr:hypothetical protein Pcinc_009922 [Petrolisthes cinctipes]
MLTHSVKHSTSNNSTTSNILTTTTSLRLTSIKNYTSPYKAYRHDSCLYNLRHVGHTHLQTYVPTTNTKNVTGESKRKAWDEITFLVNSVSLVQRARDDVKKKFTDFISAAKKKAADIRRDSQETGGGPSTETKLNPVEEAMLGTLADVQVGGLPGIRDPGPSEHDTEEEDEVELPSVELPPGPSVPSVAEPAGMIRSAATSVVDTITGTPGIPSVGSYQEVSGTAEPIAEHSYSEPSTRQSVPSQGS